MLENAWKELGKTIVDFDYAREAMVKAIDVPRTPITTSSDPLNVPYWGRNLMYWNDKDGRTEKEVLQAFDQAIAIAEKSKAAAVEANVLAESIEASDAGLIKAMSKIAK